jgi:hypothetical protein
MRYLIGIDDTDNEFSRGTGFRTRDLTSLLHENNLGRVISISRHQLFVHPEIPFTSHNSSACLDVETDDIEQLKAFSIDYLKRESAVGSDVGLCIALYQSVTERIMEWGHRAKKEILFKEEAYQIAKEENIYLEGFLGTKGGIIGALAGVGLRKSGNDGRFFWLSGRELREFNGIYPISELVETSNFDLIISINGQIVQLTDRIFVDEWLRPVMKNYKISVIVEPTVNEPEYEWKIASKEYIKSISD